METVLQDQPPEEMETIDKQIEPFKGRSNLRQCIKNKPHKWGYMLKKEGRGADNCAVDSNSGIVIVKWSDNKAINFISTYATVEPNGTCKRWSAKDKKLIKIPRPTVVS
ncbi:hypothetical protein PR048_032951 [Dryococelus australis]|uniref:PiggyBac transposable element-derived protein domain-containing protein n=1 Tax=Dryococelus australis TaxID=614101 RepID=A0ABQ9G7T1_9NEOP|nr:hypothetical protein PR048_032951 [Dryococelus australis]